MRRARTTALGLAPSSLLALLLVLSGCALLDPSPQEPTPAPVGVDLRAEAQRLLDQRARAVRRGDEALFRRSLDSRDPEFVDRQLAYFRSVAQLPWREFGYAVQPGDWQVRIRPRWGREVLVPEIVQRTRLRGFDSRAVERTVGFVVAVRGDRVLLVSDRGAGGARLFAGTPAPWDLAEVQVRRAPGVLGIFDAQTIASADTLVDAVAEGIRELDRVLPFGWPGRVVVYSVADQAVLDSFTQVPGGSIDLLGAITFPTYAVADGGALASTRMLVMPGSVSAGQPFLGRIVRHELSHVALGTRDDSAPTWLSEGLAEYLGARSVPPAERSIATQALARSRTGDVRLPASDSFNGPDQDWHYALSWMACDHIASTAGEGTLWALVDAFAATGASGPERDAVQDDVLRSVLGYDASALAQRAAARIVNLYGTG